DSFQPSVTVNQVPVPFLKNKTADHFTMGLEFSRVLFQSSDLVLSGSATVSPPVITLGPAQYDVAVTATTDGTVIVDVSAGGAQRSEERRVGKEWSAGRAGTVETDEAAGVVTGWTTGSRRQ